MCFLTSPSLRSRGVPSLGLQDGQTQDTCLDRQDDQRLPVMMPRGVWWGLALRYPKANKQARLVERKVYFISDVGNCGWGGVDVCLQADSPPPLATSGARGFLHRMGLYAETAQSALTVILKSVISGLISIIFVVLGTVNFQFPGALVPISLRPILGIMAASGSCVQGPRGHRESEATEQLSTAQPQD